EPLKLLDENQPLSTADNQKILAENQENKQRKEKFANHLKGIYEKNQLEYQNPGSGPSLLENKKTAAIFQIESKQFDMKVLADGKYQNYQSVIEGFTKEVEIENYKNEILAAIAQAKKEQKDNHPNQNKPPLISPEEKEILGASSVAEAREKAIEKFKSFLAKIGLKENEIDFKILLNDGREM